MELDTVKIGSSGAEL